jgi:hypothetical protein
MITNQRGGDMNGTSVANQTVQHKWQTLAGGPDGIETLWEFVTPPKAVEYLNRNKQNQRRYMPTLGGRYTYDMANGFWIVTHEGIAFDVNGDLIDGQHRLQGIIDSGVGLWMLVTRGLSEKAIEVINRGKMRTMAHALQVAGYDSRVANHRAVAVARAMLTGPQRYQKDEAIVTDQSLRLFMDRHLEAILFAMSVCSRNTAPATVAAAVARAYYHADPERLARFCRAMDDDIPPDDSKPEDRTARKLKTMLATVGSSQGGSRRVVLYRKAQNAISAYLAGVVLDKLYEKDDDLFPLPAEDAATSLAGD